MAVAHILRQKGSAVVTVDPADSVQNIVDTLARHRIGAVIVVDANGGIAGIVSERDVVRAMAGDAAGVSASPPRHHDRQGPHLFAQRHRG